jgi:hypothetical protein
MFTGYLSFGRSAARCRPTVRFKVLIINGLAIDHSSGADGISRALLKRAEEKSLVAFPAVACPKRLTYGLRTPDVEHPGGG